MTKDELIEKVASGAGLSKADAARVINTTIGSNLFTLTKNQCGMIIWSEITL
jgi:nucleoid DNA-binding protein